MINPSMTNWEVFTINICCFIAKILFRISIFTWVMKLGLRSGGQIYTTMQNFVKSRHSYEISRFFIFKIVHKIVSDY